MLLHRLTVELDASVLGTDTTAESHETQAALLPHRPDRHDDGF